MDFKIPSVVGFTSYVYGCVLGRQLSGGCKRTVGSVALFVNLRTPPFTLASWSSTPEMAGLCCWLVWERPIQSPPLTTSTLSFFFSFPTFYFYPCSWGYSPLSCLYDGNTVIGSYRITLYNSAFSNITLVTWNGHGVSIQSGKHNKSVPSLFPNIYQHKIGPLV